MAKLRLAMLFAGSTEGAHRACVNKLALPGWSPATFTGNHRQLAKVEH